MLWGDVRCQVHSLPRLIESVTERLFSVIQTRLSVKRHSEKSEKSSCLEREHLTRAGFALALEDCRRYRQICGLCHNPLTSRSPRGLPGGSAGGGVRLSRRRRTCSRARASPLGNALPGSPGWCLIPACAENTRRRRLKGLRGLQVSPRSAPLKGFAFTPRALWPRLELSPLLFAPSPAAPSPSPTPIRCY